MSLAGSAVLTAVPDGALKSATSLTGGSTLSVVPSGALTDVQDPAGVVVLTMTSTGTLSAGQPTDVPQQLSGEAEIDFLAEAMLSVNPTGLTTLALSGEVTINFEAEYLFASTLTVTPSSPSPSTASQLAGGLRGRLIFDNLFLTLQTALTNLGWFEQRPSYSNITLVAEEQDVTHEVPINTLALSDENVTPQPWEIGSQLSQDTRYYYIDFFAESDALGKHVIGDIQAALLGKLPTMSLTGPTLPVLDLRTQNPAELFYCDIYRVNVQRAHQYGDVWLRHWYSVQVTLFDYSNTGVPA